MNAITLTDGARQIVFPAVTDHGWYFFNLRGWHGQTSDKVRKEERPQAHGAFASARSLRSSRGISFEVGYRDGTTTEVEEAVNELSSFGAEGPIVITVEDDLSVTRRTVTVDSIPDNDPDRRYTGDMMVGLVADDSRRYAVEAQTASTGPAQPGPGLVFPEVWPLVWPAGGSSGRITLTNTGKAPSAPTFTLEGGFDTAMITCIETGARLGLNRQIPVGSSVVIDTENRTATIDGQSSVSRWLQFREWETVPAGASRTYQFDATGVVSVPAPPAVEVGRQRFTNPRAIPPLTGFTPSNGTVDPIPGGGIAFTSTAATPGGPRINWQASGYRLPVVAGETVEISADSWSPNDRLSALSILFYDASNAYITGSIISSASFGGLTPARGSRSGVVPAGAVTAAFYFGSGGAISIGDILNFDRIRFGTPGGEYFDGSMPAAGDFFYTWAGPANASESIKWFQPGATTAASLEGQVFDAWW